MKDFSEVLKLLENFKTYTSPKHLIDRAMITANKIAFPITILGIILGLIYRYTEPDIDQSIVNQFVNILLILIYFPYAVVMIVMIGSFIQIAFRFLVKLTRSDRPFELIKEMLRPKEHYPYLQREQEHDRANVIDLGQNLSLDDLKYYERVFGKIIKAKENQIIDIFGHKAEFFPILMFVAASFVGLNVKDAAIRCFSTNVENHPFDFFVILVWAALILIALAAWLQKKRNRKYVYWNELLQQAVVEQHAIAEQKAKHELKELINAIKSQLNEFPVSEKTSYISLWQRLLTLFTIKI